jgi:alpha-beta hydrolase superfamily lysophospholipase
MVELWPELEALDRPEILQFIFYPRREYDGFQSDNTNAGLIPVDDGVSISYSFFAGAKKYPNVLFFHGNGEIASDYDAIGPIYNEIGLNLFVVDYRGYGRSGGKPTLINMIKDSHAVFEGFKKALQVSGFSGSLFIMGRSLGSASAIEIASHSQDQLRGLIIESGFANIYNLLKYLGFPIKSLGIDMLPKPHSLELIRKIFTPTLVLHGEYDRIVPLEEGKALFESIGAKEKRLIIVPGVDHNTIMSGGMQLYLKSLTEFVTAYD